MFIYLAKDEEINVAEYKYDLDPMYLLPSDNLQ